MLSFPINGHIIRLSLEIEADHEKIVNAVLAYISKFDQKPPV
jgi:hypothetical protein